MGEGQIQKGNDPTPAKDSTSNVQSLEVVGSKDDTAQTAVGTTRSIIAYVKGLLNEIATLGGTGGNAFFGEVTTATSTTKFKVGALAGLGTNLLIDAYYCQVIEADSAAPEGEIQKISAYDTADGDITVDTVFSAAPAVGDYVLILHESVALQFLIADGAGDYPASVVDNSLWAHVLAKDGDASAYNDKTDSLEAISDKAGAFSGDGGAAQDDSAKASLDLLHTDIATIIADTEKIYDVALGVSPADGALASFIATGGTALGTRLPASKSLYDVIALDRLDNVTYGLSALRALLAAIPTTPTLQATWTNARAAFLDELAAANLPADVDAIKLKTDLLNSVSGTSTLSDANVSDTIVPGSLPTKMHITLDISTIIVAADDFTLEVKVGVSGSERVVAHYQITSDGTDTTIDTGSGTGAVVKARRIDISGVMVYTGEQVLLNYTKNGATDRDVLYRYVCGV